MLLIGFFSSTEFRKSKKIKRGNSPKKTLKYSND